MLFGTSGIRGDARVFFSNQFCFDIGRAFAIFLEKYSLRGTVAVGMDPRPSSQRIKESFLAGLQKEGRKTFDEGITPVPAINYILIIDDSLAGSAMITGSHIKKESNGIKFFTFKKEILKEHEREIEDIYGTIKEEAPFSKEFVVINKENEADRVYKKMLLELADLPYPKWKVVLDFSNGCQTKIIPTLSKEIGIEAIFMNDSLDPDKFIARDTETEGALVQLQERVRREEADMGIAFDPDGDRVVFVDEDGNFIPGDYTGSLIAQYSDTPVVVTPINTSQVVEHIGKPVIRTKVGSPYVVQAMENNKATYGFEANGGGFSKDIMMSRDGGSTTIKVLNLLKKTKKTLGELINILPRFFLYRVKVECPMSLNHNILERAENKFKGIKIEKIDGLKIWLTSSTWILFRPSSNAPEFRVFAESKTKEEAQKLGEEGMKFVKSIIKNESSLRNL